MKKISFFIFSVLILASCTTSRQYSAVASNEMTTENSPATETQERLVIYNASITLESKSSDSINSGLNKIAKNYDGYVLSLSDKQSVIRVKANNLNNAVNSICDLSKVKDKAVSGYDITEKYIDYQTRLDNARNARKRYLELMEKAENVEAALKVEKELERLNGVIESLEGQIKQLSHLSDYSTITVKMQEKTKPGILGYIGIGLYQSVKWLFVRN